MGKIIDKPEEIAARVRKIREHYEYKGPLGPLVPKSQLSDLTKEQLLELRSRLGKVSQQDIGSWVGVSGATFHRWETGGQRPSSHQMIFLARLWELVNGIGDELTPNELLRFLSYPHEDLFYDKPVDVLSTELGYRRVREILEGLLTGAYS